MEEPAVWKIRCRFCNGSTEGPNPHAVREAFGTHLLEVHRDETLRVLEWATEQIPPLRSTRW